MLAPFALPYLKFITKSSRCILAMRFQTSHFRIFFQLRSNVLIQMLMDNFRFLFWRPHSFAGFLFQCGHHNE